MNGDELEQISGGDAIERLQETAGHISHISEFAKPVQAGDRAGARAYYNELKPGLTEAQKNDYRLCYRRLTGQEPEA